MVLLYYSPLITPSSLLAARPMRIKPLIKKRSWTIFVYRYERFCTQGIAVAALKKMRVIPTLKRVKTLPNTPPCILRPPTQTIMLVASEMMSTDQREIISNIFD
jgi:hypothetical protein